ncbi:MAG TPA: hypothetical protein VIK99_00400 [Thermaerobacter sp.]
MLTEGERVMVIERALDSFAHRYVERRVQAAPTDKEAAREARALCGTWGVLEPGGLKILGERAGLRVRMPDGREGLVTWDELAAYVRQPRQIALPL